MKTGENFKSQEHDTTFSYLLISSHIHLSKMCVCKKTEKQKQKLELRRVRQSAINNSKTGKKKNL